MPDEVAVAISNLLDRDPDQNISSIKNAVIAQIMETDNSVIPETTDYFNHTYAPDIVLHWRSGRPDRRVYLRTYTNPAYLLEDIRVISGDQPILMALTPLDPNGQLERRDDSSDAELLAEGSAQARTLVADPSTFNALSSERREHAIGRVLSRAVLQGGRGLIDAGRARSAGETMDLAFTAAQHADSRATRTAVEAAEALLDTDHARQLTNLFQALWLGSGAPATSFPGQTDLSTSLDANILELLLDMDVTITNDDDFWRRLGSGLTLERLCEVEAPSRSANLQKLVGVNVNLLRGRSCQVNETDEQRDVSTEDAMTWFLKDGLLGLSSSRFQILISPNSVSGTDFPQNDGVDSVGILELLGRAQTSGIEIGELELEAAGGRIVNYKTASRSDVTSDKLLVDLGNALGRQLVVRSVVAWLPGTVRQIRCDLTTRRAAGHTGARFYLSEFLMTAVPLLRSMVTSELSALTAIFERPPAEDESD
jgi:hypothetical protein